MVVLARHDMRGLKDQRGVIEEEIDEQESTWSQRAKVLRDKLKLGPHHKMERFTIMLGVTLSILLLFTSVSFINYRSDVSNLESSQTVFTDEFTFSLSNQKGTVEGVYGNADKTDVMILIKMDNPTEMSVNAENYELFITTQKKKMSYAPKVSFNLFGSTGYGIIRFEHNEPLKSEILDITIRANSDLSTQQGRGSGVSEGLDGSFDKYDQAKIYVNVGAENVEVLDNLKTGEDDPRKLYIALVAEEQDKAIHEEIKTKTEELSKLLNRADEYANRLISSGYVPPEEPWFIKGDMVDEEGVFRPASYLSKSHKFDYWSKDIHDGYVNQVVDDFTKFSEYMNNRSELAGDMEERKDVQREERVEQIKEIKHESGSVLELALVTTGSSSPAEVAAKDATESLIQTWRTYLGEKSKLQRDLMGKLLILDADVQSQPIGYSEHTGDTVVTFY